MTAKGQERRARLPDRPIDKRVSRSAHSTAYNLATGNDILADQSTSLCLVQYQGLARRFLSRLAPVRSGSQRSLWTSCSPSAALRRAGELMRASITRGSTRLME